MRRAVLYFLVVNLVVCVFLIHSVWTLLTLLVYDGSTDAISRAELPAPGSDSIGGRSQMIPKIIHQTYINESIPLVWQDAQKSCIDLHSPEDGWEYKLWTDEMSKDFIAAEYPWFLETFEGYEFPIQRADAIRYFVLAFYGGIYIDLDDGCNRRLEPLLSYPAWVRRTVPTGISNDAMGSVPRHPFFLHVIDSLPRYNRHWILPYITVMASTGPLFLSILWRHWSADGHNIGDEADGGRIRILFPDEYNNHSWSFFTHHLGNSWHGKDVKLIFWLGKHWFLVTLAGFAIAGIVFSLAWCIYHRFVLSPTAQPRSLVHIFNPNLRSITEQQAEESSVSHKTSLARTERQHNLFQELRVPLGKLRDPSALIQDENLIRIAARRTSLTFTTLPADQAKLAAMLNVTFDTIANAYNKKHKKRGDVLLQEAKDAGRLDDNGNAVTNALPQPKATVRRGKSKTVVKTADGHNVLHVVTTGRVKKGKAAK
ncbi:hypothetical protein MBLNU457_1700t1 [Dothideomycetes sp. NU457]